MNDFFSEIFKLTIFVKNSIELLPVEPVASTLGGEIGTKLPVGTKINFVL